MKKRCKRKVWALVNPIQHAINGAGVTPDGLLDVVRMQELSAIEAFAKGHATMADFEAMVAMLNLCEHLASNKVGYEALPACRCAQDSLLEIAARREQTGKLGVTAQQLKALRDLYAYHDLQRQSIARSEYEQAIKKTFDRVKNCAPGVIEL